MPLEGSGQKALSQAASNKRTKLVIYAPHIISKWIDFNPVEYLNDYLDHVVRIPPDNEYIYSDYTSITSEAAIQTVWVQPLMRILMALEQVMSGVKLRFSNETPSGAGGRLDELRAGLVDVPPDRLP